MRPLICALAAVTALAPSASAQAPITPATSKRGMKNSQVDGTCQRQRTPK